MLPDNLAEIPITCTMAAALKSRFLVDDLAKVSTRLKAFSALKSFWKGQVAIYGLRLRDNSKHGRTQHMKQIIRQYVNDGTTKVILEASQGPTEL